MTTPRATSRGIGAVGIAVLVVGAVLVLLAFTSFAWYGGGDTADSRGSIRFHDLHALTQLPGSPALTRAYFGWLAWVLLILAILVGLAANLGSAATPVLRALGLLVGLAGAVATYLALAKMIDASGTSSSVFDHARTGLWLALVGFVVAGLGAAAGPLRAP